MVRAILEGRKTQTRRIVSPGNCAFGSANRKFWQHCDLNAESCFADNGYLHVPCHCQSPDGFHIEKRIECSHCIEFGWEDTRHRLYPNWEPGDRLWVRESWADSQCDTSDGKKIAIYRADGERPVLVRWRPSIHMPRWASRITLEIESVRVERVQEISEADAEAEGVEQDSFGHYFDYRLPNGYRESVSSFMTARDSFVSLWLSISGKDSWELNPWVWVLTFKRVTP